MEATVYSFAKPHRAIMRVLMACMLVLVLTVPAHAESASGSCTAKIFGKTAGHVRGTAHYAVDGAFHVWNQFEGTTTRDSIWPGGSSNNVNFFLYQDGSIVWSHRSPDNLRSGQTYAVGANVRVPASSAEQVRTEGIVDLSAAPDARCDAWTPVV